MQTTATDLGPFAPRQGAPSRWASLSIVLAAASAMTAGLRVVLDRLDAADHHAWTSVTTVLAVAAVVVGAVGMYDTSTRARRGRSLVTVAFVVAFAAGVFAFIYSGAEDGTLRLDRFATAFFDLELLADVAASLARGMLTTIRIALVAEVLSLSLGMFIATLNMSPKAWFHYPAVVYVDVIRALPLVVLTLIINGGLPFIGITLESFVSAVTILMINGAAYTSEIFRAGLQSVPRGQGDAARSLGMTHGTSMLYVIIPQAVRNVIPPLMSDFIALTKDTAIVTILIGFTVRSADLTGAARTAAASSFSPTPYVGAAIGYVLILVPLSRLVGRLERRVRAGLA